MNEGFEASKRRGGEEDEEEEEPEQEEEKEEDEEVEVEKLERDRVSREPRDYRAFPDGYRGQD